jgi:hypothetical protein
MLFTVNCWLRYVFPSRNSPDSKLALAVCTSFTRVMPDLYLDQDCDHPHWNFRRFPSILPSKCRDSILNCVTVVYFHALFNSLTPIDLIRRCVVRASVNKVQKEGSHLTKPSGYSEIESAIYISRCRSVFTLDERNGSTEVAYFEPLSGFCVLLELRTLIFLIWSSWRHASPTRDKWIC